MRVGWLCDEPEVLGGAELTQAEFRDAAPSKVDVVDCKPSEVPDDLDRYVIHNCVSYSLDDLKRINAPAVKFWHDVGPWISLDVHEWLAANALNVCCSPIQAEYMRLDAVCIPPALNLAPFTVAGERVNGSRSGSVCVGSWRNYGKAPHRAAEWAQSHGGIDFYGGGPLAPPGASEVPYEQMPNLLARYQTFVFLPTVLEPFGRVVAEAWAAGCEVVTNGLVGARYWIEERPDAIDTAAEDFWGVVLS